MAYTKAAVQAARDALWSQIQAAYQTGTWRVQQTSFSDQTVVLRTTKDALEELARLDALLAALGTGATKYVQTSKGV